MHYHLMGIGGIGMSGLALMLQHAGHRVSGCDGVLSDLTRKLEGRGIRVLKGHDTDHLQDEVEVLVVSTGIPHQEPEVLEARARNLRVIRRIEVLGDLMQAKRGIAVAGTHGKTSTTAMVATVFEGCGVDPSAAVGGEVKALGGNAKVGTGPHFIAEIDESDPLFAQVASQIAIITNIEDDHVAHNETDVRNNYHSSLEALHGAFREFASRAGCVVYCADWPGLEDFLEGALERAVSYGIKNGVYRASNLSLEGGTPKFTLTKNGAPLVNVTLMVPGEHNALNAVAALAVAHLEGLDLELAARALATFGGAGRRWEVLGQYNEALLVDDYAHNPTKVGAAIAGAKTTGKRVRVVFQPHRVVRTARDWPRYAEVLQSADEVLMLDIYTAGETPIEGVHSSLIAQKMLDAGYQNVKYYPNRADLEREIRTTAKSGEVIVTMGAGDVTRILRELLQEVKA
jgi:UDP-N-acetylmuramate--alanine ligase